MGSPAILSGNVFETVEFDSALSLLQLEVWPNTPAFWKNKTRVGNTELQQVGLWVVSAAVNWLEELTGEAKAGSWALVRALLAVAVVVVEVESVEVVVLVVLVVVVYVGVFVLALG